MRLTPVSTFPSVTLILVSVALAKAENSVPTVSLDRVVHFIAPGGSDTMPSQVGGIGGELALV